MAYGKQRGGLSATNPMGYLPGGYQPVGSGGQQPAQNMLYRPEEDPYFGTPWGGTGPGNRPRGVPDPFGGGGVGSIYQPVGGGSTPGYAAGPLAPAGGNLIGGYQPVGGGGAGANGLVRRPVSEGTTSRVGRYAGVTGGSGLNALNPMGYLPSGTAPGSLTPGTTPEGKTPLDPGMRVGQMTRDLWRKIGIPIGYQPRGY